MFMQKIRNASIRLLENAVFWRRNLVKLPSRAFNIMPKIVSLRIINPLLFPCLLPLQNRDFKTSLPEHEQELQDNISHIILLAKIALENGDKQRAEAILNMGLQLCDKHNTTYGLPFIYDILALIAMSNGEVDKAEKWLVTVIEQMLKDGKDEANHHIIDFKLRQARIYSALQEYDLAEIGFKTCMNAQQQKISSGDLSTRTGLLYINILFWYGIHKARNKGYSSAKSLLDTAYGYTEKMKGLSPYQEMVILYTLADLNMELGKFDIALVSMQNAVMLGKGIGSTDLARCYIKLARIYYSMNVYEPAKVAANEGIKLATLFNHYDALEDGRELLQLMEEAPAAASARLGPEDVDLEAIR